MRGAAAALAALSLAGCVPSASTPADPASASPTPDVVAPATPSAQPAPDTPPGWRLVWQDDFAGDRLDPGAWTALDASTFGDGNDELACLLDDSVTVRGGVLRITAQRAERPLPCGRYDRRFPSGRPYTSGLIETKNKVSFEYGRFEIRARTPTPPGASKGLWPAFWLRPESLGRGELDVLELVGTAENDLAPRNIIRQTIHDDYSGTHRPEWNDYVLPSGNPDSGYHTYAAEWEPGIIRWYVDGVPTFFRSAATTPWLDEAFTGPFFLRINLAVGGRWAGEPDASTAFPAEYLVDWVRVYQR